MSRSGLLFVGNFLSGRGSNPTYSEDITRRLEARLWPVVRTSNRASRAQRLVDMVSTAYKRRRDYALAHVDVFSGSAFMWAEAVCFELRRLGKPYVLTLRGGNLPAFARRWPRRVRHLLGSARVITTPSGFLRDAMAKFAANIVVIPNALDVSQYESGARARAAPRLIWLRAFHSVYNPTMAVEALARVSCGEATLEMIGVDKGDGSLQAVERRAVDLGIRDRLTVVPGIPKRDVPRHLANASVFLNTTDVDNTPVSVLEAMASGLCIVSTDVGGLPYLVEQEQTGLLVRPRDAAAMAHAIDRVLSDDQLSARLSNRAREHARAFDWVHVIAVWEQLFAEVMANG